MNNQPTYSSFNLPNLTKRQINSLLKYADQVLINQQKMLKDNGENILHYTLQEINRHTKFNHYPKNDRIDFKTGSQYFYHCHRENIVSEEHGHFHCYLRKSVIPKYIKPLKLAKIESVKETNLMTHLIAIGMNRLGQPIRLFTVNRWVTSEEWYSARHAQNLTRKFKMNGLDNPYWQVLDKWIEGIIHLFTPQIYWLHKERDEKIAKYKQNKDFKNIYANKEIEEISTISINLEDQIKWILKSAE